MAAIPTITGPIPPDLSFYLYIRLYNLSDLFVVQLKHQTSGTFDSLLLVRFRYSYCIGNCNQWDRAREIVHRLISTSVFSSTRTIATEVVDISVFSYSYVIFQYQVPNFKKIV